ncbi:anti-sigma factor [soil metagenome]
MDYGRPDLADRLAAAYVTGTLRGPARRRFEALLPAHPALRAARQAWQERLMPLTLAIEPVQPPPRVWQKIETRIGGQAGVASGSAAGASAASGEAKRGWWMHLAFWRGLSAIAGVAALSLAVLLMNPGPVQAPIVVVLSAATPSATGVTPASFVASISGDGRALVTRPLVNVSLEANRALELWSVPATGAPRSLGLISSSGATVVRKGKVLDGTAALAVSLEPPGGSPTGAPTGPILYVGKLTL